MILDHYQKHVRKSIHTMANPKQQLRPIMWCVFVLEPLSLSLVCVFVSQKKKKVSLFIKTGTINYVSLSSPKHNIG